MKARATLLSWLSGLGLLLLAAGAPAEALAQCCAPPPPPVCCAPPPPPECCNNPPPTCCHTVNVPGVNVNVASTVVVNANSTAVAGARAGAAGGAGVIYYGGGGGGGYYTPPMTTGVMQLNVEGGKRMKRTAYEASRSRTRRVVIQAVCIDDRQTPHPASQVRPEREVADGYDGEIYRCIAGAWLQATIADFDGKIDFSGGTTMTCAKGEALYHRPGGSASAGEGAGAAAVECRRQKPARDCNERSLLRRFGAGVKILTIVTTERYTAYREEEESSESYTSSMSMDGGVGGTVY